MTSFFSRPVHGKIRICCFFLLLVFQIPGACGQSKLLKYMPAAVQIKPNVMHGFFTGEVKLLDGPFKESQDAEANYLLSLDVNRLIAPYLAESGLIPKAKRYPGWETETLPGVALCFYLSGAARLYMMTGNNEFLVQINYILGELELCQKMTNGFILGTKGGRQIMTRVEKEGFFPQFGNWKNGEATPYYSLEKLFSGLRDVYRICHIQKALQISVHLGNWLARHMSFIDDSELQKLMMVEYGGMNWVLADLYADTGDKRFLQLSRRWQDNVTVIPAVNGQDVLTGKHANMQFPKFAGLAARYPYSGDAGDLSGATFFWDNVVNHRSYVTGGNSESEYFGPRDSLSKKLTPFTEENCNEYNMLRLTKLLLDIEPRMEYVDYMERTLFNHLLSAQDPANGKICYYLPLMPGAKKVYEPLFESFKCCVCSAMDSYTRYAEYIYTHNDSSIFVNLLIPSELDYAEKGINIIQTTNFPEGQVSTLSIKCTNPVKTELCIRDAYWANQEMVIRINGVQQKAIASDDRYFHLDQTWQNGDVVEITFPMKLRVESMPDDKNRVALFYGPVLLAAKLSDTDADDLVRSVAPPAIVTGTLAVNNWLKPSETPLHFTTTVGRSGQYEVVPLFQIKTGAYSVYWQKFSEREWIQQVWANQQKEAAESKKRQLMIDELLVCDSIASAIHHLTGTSTTGYGNLGILNNQCWRVSNTNSFGYELAVSDTKQNKLVFKFMGRTDYEKWNCKITVDGIVITTLIREKDDAYPVSTWEAAFPIPLELTTGKKKVSVQFEPVEENNLQMPRLIGISTLTD